MSFHSTTETRGLLRSLAGLVIGAGTQAYFLITVIGLFSYLRYGISGHANSWLLVDVALALQFAIPHSILLHPIARRKMRPWISPEFYGIFFCFCTCISLQLMFQYWQESSTVLWDLNDTVAGDLILLGFYGSWAALLYSISLTGLGFQTGLTQWVFWYQQKAMPRREFVPRGAYHFLRHPVYLSFLGLIWFTPRMTADHAMLTAVWSVYIAVGSILKDRRLLFYLGDTYRIYMESVSGYPFLRSGPLGRLPAVTTTDSDDSSDSGPSLAFPAAGVSAVASNAIGSRRAA